MQVDLEKHHMVYKSVYPALNYTNYIFNFRIYYVIKIMLLVALFKYYMLKQFFSLENFKFYLHDEIYYKIIHISIYIVFPKTLHK